MARMTTVDLTTGSVVHRETLPSYCATTLAVAELGARLLYDLVGPEVDPLGPGQLL